MPLVSTAGKWKYSHRVKGIQTSSNYVDFTQFKGNIYYVYSRSNRNYSKSTIYIQKAKNIKSRPGRRKIAITTNMLSQDDDYLGRPISAARTVGITNDGNKCYMSPSVGAGYYKSQSSYHEAYAESGDCINWDYYGPVLVDGEVKKSFNGSFGHIFEDGINYISSTGGIVPFRKKGAITIIQFDKETLEASVYDHVDSPFKGDRPEFSDMEYCDGKYHILYDNGWNVRGDIIRHMSSEDFVNWKLEDNNIGIRDYKGMNIACVDNTLYGLRSSGRMYRYYK